MSRSMHLIQGGRGMGAKSACGRNVLRMPLGTDWEGFKATPIGMRCVKCAESKTAALNARRESQTVAAELAKLADGIAAGDWEPEAPDAWKAADDALRAANKARKASRT